MNKYYYKDANGNKRKYIGNIKEDNGKLIGTLVNSSVDYKYNKLTEEDSKDVVDKTFTYLVWKDKFGIEHEVNDDTIITNNKVVDRREYKFKIDYHPEVSDKIEFIRKDNRQLFNGEIIEQDGKYFAKA